MLRRRLILSSTNFWNRVVNLFRTRVLADAGVFEAENCLQKSLPILGQNLYDKASLIIAPNAYKAGKLYSLKPTNGSGDLTFSRASARTRINASGAIESLANDVPAIEYPADGSCPALQFDPQRTNLIQNNVTLSGYSLVGGAIASNIFTEDNSTGNHVVNTGFYSGFAANTIYCYSVILKKLSGGNRWAKINVSDSSTGEVSSKWLNLQTGALSGSESFAGNWLSSGLTTGVMALPNGRYLFYITAQNSSLNTSLIRCYFSDTGSTTGYLGTGATFEYYHPQGEAGQYPTSRIVTGASAVTRTADRITALVNSTLFGPSFTWFVHVKNNVILPNGGTHLNGPFIGNGTQGLFFATTATPDRLRLWTQVAGNVYQTAANEVKLAVVSNGTTFDVFANGVKVVTGFSYAFTFDRIGVNNPNIPLFLQGMHLYARALSDAECISLTTL